MHLRTQQIQIVIVSLLFLFAGTRPIMAQPTNEKAFFVGLQIMPGYSSYANSPNTLDFSHYKLHRTPELNVGINAQYFFTKELGLETGIFLLTHTLNVSVGMDSSRYPTMDSENEPYDRIVTGDSISESTILRTLNIPINIVYHYPLSKKITFFVSGGPGVAFPIQKCIALATVLASCHDKVNGCCAWSF